MARPLNISSQIETQGLIIRCPELADIPFIYDAVRESIAEMKLWLPWATESYSVESCEDYIRASITRFSALDDLQMHAFDKTTNKFLMGIGFQNVDWDIPKVEFYYWCRTSETRKGYVTEAVQGLSQFAFEALVVNRIEIRCTEKNLKSAAVAERCGYKLEGILVNNERTPVGELTATRLYA